MRAVAAAIVLAAGVLAGCSVLPTPAASPIDQLPVGVKVVTPPEELRLTAINQTTVAVVLTVNGQRREFAPGASEDLGIEELGPLPWDLAFSNGAGRVLLHDVLRPGVVSRTNTGNGTGEATGFLARVDLSCGQLFLVTNVASYGPAPGSGEPGDCD